MRRRGAPIFRRERLFSGGCDAEFRRAPMIEPGGPVAVASVAHSALQVAEQIRRFVSAPERLRWAGSGRSVRNSPTAALRPLRPAQLDAAVLDSGRDDADAPLSATMLGKHTSQPVAQLMKIHPSGPGEN